MDDSNIICDADSKLSPKETKLCLKDRDNDEPKTIPKNFNKKIVTCKTHFTCISINYYLLLSDKISSKTKTFITILQHKTKNKSILKI